MFGFRAPHETLAAHRGLSLLVWGSQAGLTAGVRAGLIRPLVCLSFGIVLCRPGFNFVMDRDGRLFTKFVTPNDPRRRRGMTTSARSQHSQERYVT